MTFAASDRAPFPNLHLGEIGELPDAIATLRDAIAPLRGASAEARAGQLLASAIFHGALLDRVWWQRWLEAALWRPSLANELLWVEMAPLSPSAEEPDSQPRRWFADPITRLLLVHWHRDDLPNRSHNPDVCLAAYFGAPDRDWGDLLLRHARLHWQLRIPPLLVAHALGEHRVVPVPTNEWLRLMGLDFDRASGPFTRPHPSAKFDPLEQQIYRLLLSLKRQPNSPSGKSASAGAVRRLQASQTFASLASALADWSLFMLTKPRGRLGIGFAPSTIAGYLTCLAAEVFKPEENPMSWTFEQLEARYDVRLSQIDSGSRRTKTLHAIAHFHRFLCSSRPDLAPLPEHLEHHRAEGKASANLLSPDEFKRSVALCTTIEQKVCLILSFRAGLRLRETLGLLTSDFHLHDDGCDLIIERNKLRKLKTLTSRRILPLDLLLEADELELLLHWVTRRRILTQASHARGLLIGPLDAKRPLRETVELKKLDAILHRATGAAPTVHHLRHSFATYLLATMLLPEDTGNPIVPHQLQSVISPERKRRLADRLLGPEKLGQHALHCVSAMLGHVVSTTTLRWYTHLLDLSLFHQVSRETVEAALPLTQVRALTGQESLKVARQLPPPFEEQREAHRRPLSSLRPLDGLPPQLWQVTPSRGRRTRRLERVLRGPTSLEKAKKQRAITATPIQSSNCDWRDIVAAISSHSDHPRRREWRASADAVMKLILKSGRARHSREALEVPRSRKWLELVDHHWGHPLKLTAIERRALFFAVAHWDNSRSGVRFRSRPLALAWRDLLRKFMFSDEQVHLAVSGQFAQRSSRALHSLLGVSDDLPGTAARRGWRGTIMVSFQGNAENARQFRSAAYFLILMLAIDEGFLGDRSV